MTVRVVRQGTIQSLRIECGLGFLRDTEGAEVFIHRSVLPSPLA
jgi:hypothetical protein